MLNLFTALARAVRDLAEPRVLAVLFLPMLVAIALWSVLAYVFWDTWTGAFTALLVDTAAARWLAQHGASWMVQGAGIFFVIALLLPAIVITAIVVTELFAMPAIVSVASRRYPTLEKRKGGTLIGSVANAAIAIGVFAALWLITLPLWFTGIGAIVLPALNSAYLNQKLFRYDALAEHAGRDEYIEILTRNRLRLFGLGLLLAPLYYVPFVNLAAPVFVGLAFTHLCLAELADLRRGA
jgi:uncharacterized protein involved in cysteine biosynthesis